MLVLPDTLTCFMCESTGRALPGYVKLLLDGNVSGDRCVTPRVLRTCSGSIVILVRIKQLLKKNKTTHTLYKIEYEPSSVTGEHNHHQPALINESGAVW